VISQAAPAILHDRSPGSSAARGEGASPCTSRPESEHRSDHAHSRVCPMVRVSLTQAELHVLIRAIERDATSAEEEGRMSAADSLSWRVAALREAMR
jgi:hypothetical protein